LIAKINLRWDLVLVLRVEVVKIALRWFQWKINLGWDLVLVPRLEVARIALRSSDGKLI
jgi:hypothetical protein